MNIGVCVLCGQAECCATCPTKSEFRQKHQMKITEIKNDEMWNKAVERLDEIWSGEPSKIHREERKRLFKMIIDYENKMVDIPPPSAEEAADFRKEQEGGTETRMKLKTLQKLCHEIATEKGWHDRENTVSELVANIHREASELWEWYRKGDGPSDHIPNFTGTEEEAADIIIRVLDWAEEYEWDVLGAIKAKCEYNKTRSYRHGNKRA